MKTIKLTDSQIENLIDFLEVEFIPSIQRNPDCDNINYLVDMCDIYKQLKDHPTEKGEGEMKTGIIRRIDDLGRIVIPREIRRKLNIKEGDPLEVSLDGNKVIFEPYIPTCDYEDSINRIIERLKQDEYLSKGKNKAISALKEAMQHITNHSTEKDDEQE